MAYNGSGVFVLSQPAFVAGTTISAAAVNSDLSDIANNGLSKCVTVDGQNPILGAIKFANGTVAAPSISFGSETSSGWYWASSHTIDLAVNGANVISATTTGVTITGALSFSGAINEGEVTVASAATVAIGAAAGNYLLISGVVTITAFDTIAAGAERTLEFQGIVTLTHNGTTLILPGAANIQTAAGDVAKFRSEGSGNWRCVSYLRATPQPPPAIANPWSGFDTPQNLNLTASSISGNTLLQVAVKTSAGNDPTVAAPVWFPFRDVTNANGGPVWIAVTAALSINTNATGATLATQNSKPFRLWVLAFNNAGTVVLALWHSGSGASAIASNPLNEGVLTSTTGISAAATAAGTFYTSNGTNLVSKSFRIIGYVEYTSGLATAGTYSAAPDIVQLFGPGIKKPGDLVQTIYSTTTTHTTNASTAKTATNLTGTITPTSNVNLVKVTAMGSWQQNTGSGGNSNSCIASLWRGTGTTQIGTISTLNGSSASSPCVGQVSLFAVDNPQSAAATQYGVYIQQATGSDTVDFLSTLSSIPTNTGAMTLDEIMG